MKLLVTGGSGFIGRILINDLLSQSHDIKNLDLSKSELHPELTFVGDVRDVTCLTAVSAGAEAVIHLAAEHRDDVDPIERYYDINVGGARSVLAAARANNILTIVFTSTVAVYGLNMDAPDEECPPKPFNHYGRSKLEAENLLTHWANEDTRRRLIIIRPAVVFGENNRGNVHTLITQIDSGRFFIVGNGSNKKSMAYVGNLSNFVCQTLTLETGCHIFNYADKPDLSTGELVALICKALGRKMPLRIPYPAALAAGYAFDGLSKITGRSFPFSAVRVRKFFADTRIATKRIEDLGFAPQYTIEDGLRRMIDQDFSHRRTGARQ